MSHNESAMYHSNRCNSQAACELQFSSRPPSSRAFLVGHRRVYSVRYEADVVMTSHRTSLSQTGPASFYDPEVGFAEIAPSPLGPFSVLQGQPLAQYPSRLLTMFFKGSPFSNLTYCFRKKRIA